MEQLTAKKITPLRAIRDKCLDCCCGSGKEVRLCNVKKCPLFLYRSGHKPKADRNIVDEV